MEAIRALFTHSMMRCPAEHQAAPAHPYCGYRRGVRGRCVVRGPLPVGPFGTRPVSRPEAGRSTPEVRHADNKQTPLTRTFAGPDGDIMPTYLCADRRNRVDFSLRLERQLIRTSHFTYEGARYEVTRVEGTNPATSTDPIRVEVDPLV
jgi:hypothetical protein